MRNCIHKKASTAMVMKKIICLLMITIFIVSLSGSAFVTAYEDTFTSYEDTFTSDPAFEGEIICFYDIPIIDIDVEDWYSDITPTTYGSIVPLNQPTVSLIVNEVSNTSIHAWGSLMNPGGANITQRGFWFRRNDETITRELLVSGGFEFDARIGSLTPGGTYYVRAIVRTPGMGREAYQSDRWVITLPTAPAPTPPPGNTPTPPPSGVTPTPPPSGPTPTPPPVGPFLSFSPSNAAPWNRSEWTPDGGHNSAITTVNANQSWSWNQSSGSEDWLTVSGSGVPGSQITISVGLNVSGARRTATVTVTSGNLSEQLTIAQRPIMAAMRGTRVIECFGRNGYVDVNSSATTTTIQCVSRASVNRPIWNFVHVQDSIFAIRNETTGRYFTETGGNLRHEERIAGANYSNQQLWYVIPQIEGPYRIRSVSNNTLYLQDGSVHFLNNPALTLASRDASHNRQLWWIGYIWHVDPSYARNGINWVGFWGGAINIRPQALEQNASAEFYVAVNIARDFWERELGITFDDARTSDDANIRVYWGTRIEFLDEIDRFFVRDTVYGVAIPPVITENYTSGIRGRVRHGTIQAGGSMRTVYRLYGTGDVSMRVGIWSGTARNVNVLPFTATHELGHALGYWGHAPNSSDLMSEHPGRNPEINLRPAEREHIMQIYRRFR